jgi:hypothetical protein
VRLDAIRSVARNDISGTGLGPTDDVPRRTLDLDSVASVRDRGLPDPIGANVIAPQAVVRGGGAAQLEAVRSVARDHVAGGHVGAPDRIVRCTIGDVDAVVRVAQGGGSGEVRSDEVPVHDIVGRAAAVEGEPLVAVARNQIGRSGCRATDRVAGSAGGDDDAVTAVAHIQQARRVRPDEVPHDPIACGAGAVDRDAIVRVSRDHIPCASIRAADGVVRRIHHVDAVVSIRPSDGARAIRPHEVALERVAPGRIQSDSVNLETADGQPADRAAAGGDAQTVRGARVDAVEFDQRRVRVTRLRRAIDDHRIGDDRQR